MDALSDELKKAVSVAQVFVSVTLSREKLSSEAEKERKLLSDWLKTLKTKIGEPLSDETTPDISPPWPPKGSEPVKVEEESEAKEEIYDDVTGSSNEKEDDSAEEYETMDQEKEKEEGDDSAEDYEAMDDGETVESKDVSGIIADVKDYEVIPNFPEPPVKEEFPPEITEENYEVPQQEEENYEEPAQTLEPTIQEDSNYEVTDPSPPSPESQVAPAFTEDSNYEGIQTYEGIELMKPDEQPEPTSTDGPPLPGHKRTGTVQLENLELPIKADEIVGKITEGLLWKDRKVDKHHIFGSKWQKRHVVVRDYALYYYKNKTDKEQRGTILLPGYSVALCKNKDKEFELTVGDGRTFKVCCKFMAESKDDASRWINAIRKAANANLSDRQSTVLDALRDKDSSCDDDSLHYEGVGDGNAVHESPPENGEETYDDIVGVPITDDIYEIPGAGAAGPAQTQTMPVEYEISSVAPSQPQEVMEEEYEVAEEPLRTPPPRPVKQPQPQQQQQEEPVGEVKDTLIQDDEYEVACLPPPVLQPQPPSPRPAKSEPEVEDKAPEQPPRPGAKPPIPAHPSKKKPIPVPQERKDEPQPSEEMVINYANVYMALWNCQADDEHDLGFNRGDLIYVYEKPHPEWWIGSLFKPQGYKVGLLPMRYVMDAYEL